METAAEEEFRDFVQARWQPLVRTAILLAGDQGRAEDLVQQTLVIVHRKWRHIDPGARSAYASAVLVNESASWFRCRRHTEVPLDCAGQGAWTPRRIGPCSLRTSRRRPFVRTDRYEEPTP